MKKQNWEEKFDKFIEPAIDDGFDDGEFSQKSYRDRFVWQGDIKDFIRQLLTEQKKKFRKLIKESRPLQSNDYAIVENELLDDLLEKLDKK